MPTVLHVGCGPKRKDQTTRGFDTADWNELRLDIVGTMLDMKDAKRDPHRRAGPRQRRQPAAVLNALLHSCNIWLQCNR